MYLTEKKKCHVQERLRNRKLFIIEDRKEDIDMRSLLHDLDLPAQIPVRTSGLSNWLLPLIPGRPI